MENTKKRKKALNGFLYIVVLVLIGVIVYQNHQIRKLSRAVKSDDETAGKIVLEQDDITQKSATGVTVPVDRGNGQGDYHELKYQLDAAEEELVMLNEQLADEMARNDESANSVIQGPMAMLKTSEGKKRLRNALKNGFDQSYGSLFKELNLSLEKKEQLKELMADQQIASMEFGNELQNASLTEEDRNNFLKQLKEQNKQNDAALAALLGEQNFETYWDYRDKSRERQMIQMFSQRLAFDDTLTGGQKTSLLESLYNKRKDTYSQHGFDEENVSFPLGMNDVGVPKIMERELLVYDGYIKGVEEVGLSKSQEKQIKGFLEQQQAMTKSMIERQAKIASGEIDPNSSEQDYGIVMIFR